MLLLAIALTAGSWVCTIAGLAVYTAHVQPCIDVTDALLLLLNALFGRANLVGSPDYTDFIIFSHWHRPDLQQHCGRLNHHDGQ